MFAHIPSDFSFLLPDRSHMIFVIFSHNAFRATIEIVNRMRSIRLSLTCQTPSNSSKWHICSSDCALPMPDFPSDFPTNPSNHQIIGQWDATLRRLWGFCLYLFLLTSVIIKDSQLVNVGSHQILSIYINNRLT